MLCRPPRGTSPAVDFAPTSVLASAALCTGQGPNFSQQEPSLVPWSLARGGAPPPSTAWIPLAQPVASSLVLSLPKPHWILSVSLLVLVREKPKSLSSLGV